MKEKRLVVQDDVLSLLSEESCREWRLVPLERVGQTLRVAMANPTDVSTIDRVRFATGFKVEPVPATEEAIDRAISSHYVALSAGKSPSEGPSIIVDDAGEPTVPTEEVGETPDDLFDPGSIVKTLDGFLARAVEDRASHVHFDPLDRSLRVRFRVEGLLRDEGSIPAGPPAAALVSRLKIMAQMDVAQRRLPQDGRLKIDHGRRSVEARVHALPTARGERVVLSLTDPGGTLGRLEDLGFRAEDLARLQGLVGRSSGLFLIAGPRRSGKSTTLYSLMDYYARTDHCVLTAEDPVIRLVTGVGQTPVNHDIGLSAGVALAAFSRQDPDLVLVPRITDSDTLLVAARTSLDVCPVVTSLESRDAPGGLLALLRLGAPTALVAEAVRMVFAQRLVRRLCDVCKLPREGSAGDLDDLSLPIERPGEAPVVFEASGCPVCSGTGYRGRIPVCEILAVTDAVKSASRDEIGYEELKATAEKEGLESYAHNTLQRVLEGVTSVSEYRRIEAEARFG